ncbi:hypothetical protein FDP41_001277 [Naegleria fowleri]|uniref:CN hydrolase domain-containing protein n=1 Tax=Naegleria fowleri TaxID=5763 RepID=A0A6A5C2W5_NAEFO|nr:uncharacterized protein FDP41_001277 [Naegleria fowleri]KAF0979609.1 hypothetical protein FDP41_001277 [Naegleria fowleri]CAG4716133.1 unnamed protein product [Naegleria fowleri]
MANKLRIGLCQLFVTADKTRNIKNAVEKIRQAKDMGAELVVLPECFNSPYGTQYFKQYAEDPNHSDTLDQMAQAAKDNQVYLVSGSIPTIGKNSDKYFNSCFVFDREGKRIGRYDKIHLFEIDTPTIKFKELEILSPGSELFSFHIPEKGATIGIGICFDIRFPELASIYQSQHQCNVLVYPGAFNMTTGPLHWNLLARGRAVDNQLFTVLCSPARDETASYVAYGNSLIVDPLGDVIQQHDEKESISVTEIDLSKVQTVRNQIPSLHNKRHDLYEIRLKK